MQNPEAQKKEVGSVRPIINILVQLQDLLDARAQREAASIKPHFENLDKSISLLLKELPLELRTQFVKLQKKDHVAVALASERGCSACAMNLPISMVYNIRNAEKIFTCPNCARFLHYPDGVIPGSKAQRSRRFAPKESGIARFSSESLMLPHISATTAEEVITELTTQLVEAGFFEDREILIEEALRREALASTAVSGGLAFPHIRGLDGGGMTVVLGTSAKGIKYDPAERLLTRIIFLVVIPTAASAFYLKLLSGLTQSFRDKVKCEKLLAAKTPDKLWKALLSTTKTTIR